MVEDHNLKSDNKGQLNLFSDELTLELKTILEQQFNAKPNEIETQEIGRHIAQFVLLKEVLV